MLASDVSPAVRRFVALFLDRRKDLWVASRPKFKVSRIANPSYNHQAPRLTPNFIIRAGRRAVDQRFPVCL